jgi:hypothetical protein
MELIMTEQTFVLLMIAAFMVMWLGLMAIGYYIHALYGDWLAELWSDFRYWIGWLGLVLAVGKKEADRYREAVGKYLSGR